MSELEIDLEAEIKGNGEVWMNVDQLIELFDRFPQPELREMTQYAAYTLRKVKEKALAGGGRLGVRKTKS